jgi:hypothetical protein
LSLVEPKNLASSSFRALTNKFFLISPVNYRKLTEACQTKANSKKNTGITGKTLTIGSKSAYASGNFASNRAISYIYIFF